MGPYRLLLLSVPFLICFTRSMNSMNVENSKWARKKGISYFKKGVRNAMGESASSCCGRSDRN